MAAKGHARETADPLSFLQAFRANTLANPDYHCYDESLVRNHLHLHSASLPPTSAFPTVTGRFTVKGDLCNPVGYLAGGATATILDIVTSMTLLLLSAPGLFQRGGVTTSLNVSYVQEVGPGDEVEVVGECIRMGKMIGELIFQVLFPFGKIMCGGGRCVCEMRLRRSGYFSGASRAC